jgi:hypothetical protein
MALRKLLAPYYNMGHRYAKPVPSYLTGSLLEIVKRAGILSREMRRCGDVIYHWPPTFKDGT